MVVVHPHTSARVEMDSPPPPVSDERSRASPGAWANAPPPPPPPGSPVSWDSQSLGEAVRVSRPFHIPRQHRRLWRHTSNCAVQKGHMGAGNVEPAPRRGDNHPWLPPFASRTQAGYVLRRPCDQQRRGRCGTHRVLPPIPRRTVGTSPSGPAPEMVVSAGFPGCPASPEPSCRGAINAYPPSPPRDSCHGRPPVRRWRASCKINRP